MLKCPSCGNDIPVDMHQILSSSSISCPACGLRIDINKSKSDKAIEALKEIENKRKESTVSPSQP